MRRTNCFLCFITLLLLLSVSLAGHSHYAKRLWHQKELPAARQLVHRLGLTDFALWTEARYTRNPALADFFAPFQDFPAAFEHFPSGSIITPAMPIVDTRFRLRASMVNSPR